MLIISVQNCNNSVLQLTASHNTYKLGDIKWNKILN